MLIPIYKRKVVIGINSEMRMFYLYPVHWFLRSEILFFILVEEMKRNGCSW